METEAFSHGGLTFAYASGPIASEPQRERLAAAATGRAPLPEEVYLNHVAVSCPAAGWTLRLDAAGALRAWHAAQVASGTYPGRDGGGPDPTCFDWTYSVGEYDGDVSFGESLSAAAGQLQQQTWVTAPPAVGAGDGAPGAAADTPHAPSLPLAKLRRTDVPILFYASVPLYADELHDRGRTEAVVKLRVMSDCFLLLARTYTRVDGVRVALRDVRWYADLPPGGGGSGGMLLTLLKDVQVRQADMGRLRAAMGLPPLPQWWATPMLVADRLAAQARESGALPPWLQGSPPQSPGAGGTQAQPPLPPPSPPQDAMAATGALAAAVAGGADEATAAAAAAPLRLDVSADEVYAALQGCPLHAAITRITLQL
jgi:hypothetical protein